MNSQFHVGVHLFISHYVVCNRSSLSLWTTLFPLIKLLYSLYMNYTPQVIVCKQDDKWVCLNSNYGNYTGLTQVSHAMFMFTGSRIKLSELLTEKPFDIQERSWRSSCVKEWCKVWPTRLTNVNICFGFFLIILHKGLEWVKHPF